MQDNGTEEIFGGPEADSANDDDGTSVGEQQQEIAVELATGEAKLDEYGNVIVEQRVYTEMELAQMQAIYPQGMLFTQENIRNGGSILFLMGKCLQTANSLLIRYRLLLFRHLNGHAKLH